jgi:hypothetical protein
MLKNCLYLKMNMKNLNVNIFMTLEHEKFICEHLKGNRKEIKIVVSAVKNLGIELDQPNVVIPFQSMKVCSFHSNVCKI